MCSLSTVQWGWGGLYSHEPFNSVLTPRTILEQLSSDTAKLFQEVSWLLAFLGMHTAPHHIKVRFEQFFPTEVALVVGFPFACTAGAPWNNFLVRSLHGPFVRCMFGCMAHKFAFRALIFWIFGFPSPCHTTSPGALWRTQHTFMGSLCWWGGQSEPPISGLLRCPSDWVLRDEFQEQLGEVGYFGQNPSVLAVPWGGRGWGVGVRIQDFTRNGTGRRTYDASCTRQRMHHKSWIWCGFWAPHPQIQ